jgi:hypothetical protein
MKSVCDSYARTDTTGDERLVGERNETSVLFSLANLRSMGTSAPSQRRTPPRSNARATAAGDGSGLIDLRALVRAGALGTPGSASSPSKSESVEELLSIGSGNAPFAPMLAAPLLAPPRRERRSAGLIVGAGVSVAALVAAVTIVLVVVLDRAPAPAPPRANTALRAVVRASAMPPSDMHVAEHTTSTSTPTLPSPTAAVESSSTTAHLVPTPRAHVVRHTTAARGDADAESAPHAGTAAETARTPLVPRPHGETIAQILDRVGTASEAQPAPARNDADVTLPAQLSRAQVLAGLSAVRAAAAVCGAGQHGLAMTAITVSGSSGAVTSAIVSGQFAGTPVGSCVARAARGAHFPRFRSATFSVNFPFGI